MTENASIQKKLLSGLFWVLLLNILIKPFWILGIEVGVQDAVGIEQYGLYFAIFNLAYIFNTLLDLGVTNFNTRNIAQHPVLIQKHLSGIFSLKMLLFALYLVVTFTVGWIMGYQSRQFWLLLFVSINQFLNSMIVYLRSNFEGLLLFRLDSLFSILDRVLMIVICGALLLFSRSNFPIEWFVYAQTVSYLITFGIAMVALKGKVGFHRPRFKKALAWSILKKSAPFALLVLLMACYNRLDPVLLQWLLPETVGNYQSGLYASAFRLLDAITMVAYLVSVPLLPVYSKVVALPRHDADGTVGSITQMTFSFLMVFAVGAAVTFSFMSRPLMDVLYSKEVESIAQVFVILIYGIVPISFTYIFGTLLTANGSLRQLNIFASVAILINVVLNMLLIPRWQAVGSAVSSLAAQSFMAIAQMVLALNIFSLRPSWGYLIRLGAYVAVAVGCNRLLWMAGLVWWQWLAVAIGVCVAAGILLRLIDVRNMLKLLKT